VNDGSGAVRVGEVEPALGLVVVVVVGACVLVVVGVVGVAGVVVAPGALETVTVFVAEPQPARMPAPTATMGRSRRIEPMV